MDQKQILNIPIFYLFLYVFSLNIYGAEIVIKDIMDHYLVLMWRIVSVELPQYDANENDKNGKIGFLVGKLWDIHSVNCSYTYLPNPVNIGQTFHAGLQIQKHKYKHKYTNTVTLIQHWSNILSATTQDCTKLWIPFSPLVTIGYNCTKFIF